MTKKVLLLLALITLLPCAARASVKKVPIKSQSPVDASLRLRGVGPLFSASSAPVNVVVKDERPEGPILAVSRGSGKGLDFYAAEEPGAIARLVESAANETLPMLGLKPGDGGVTLEIVIREFRVEVYSFAGWGFAGFVIGNYLGWGSVGATLRFADGREPFAATYPVALYYTLNVAKKLTGESLAFLYERLALEVAAKALIAGLGLKPEPAQVRKLLAFPTDPPTARNAGESPARSRAAAVFWAGFASGGDPAAIERLYQVFRTEEQQFVYQEAAIALARAKAPGAAEEIEAVLTGKKKLAEWEPNDAEQAWYLLHALGILGVEDLASKVPKTKNLQAELRDVVKLDETGELPAMSPAENTAYEKAKAEVGR